MVLDQAQVHAAACQMVEMRDPNERLDTAINDDDWTRIVLVGVVTEEIPTALDHVTGHYEPIAEPAINEHTTRFQSTIRVESVLMGDVQGGEFVLSNLSEEWQCSSGPRLPEGQRALLLIGQWPSSTGSNVPGVWQTHLIGGQVFLTNDEAVMADYQAAWPGTTRTHLGNPRAVVNYVADRVGASGESREAALAAVSAPIAEPRDDFNWLPMSAGLVVVGAIALGCLFLVRRRQSQHG
jgi:hypothetical protein